MGTCARASLGAHEQGHEGVDMQEHEYGHGRCCEHEHDMVVAASREKCSEFLTKLIKGVSRGIGEGDRIKVSVSFFCVILFNFV